jgi:hypothetical protein
LTEKSGKKEEESKKKWIQIKSRIHHGGIVSKYWSQIFEKLENLALKRIVPWCLLISLAASTIESDFHEVAFFVVTLLFVRFIPSLTGQGGMTMHQLQSMSGLKLRTPSSMMNLLLMPSLVRC